MTAIFIPESEIWACRERALAVLIEIAESEDENYSEPDRVQSAAIILDDIRLHMDRVTDERIAEMERIAAELRKELRGTASEAASR